MSVLTRLTRVFSNGTAQQANRRRGKTVAPTTPRDAADPRPQPTPPLRPAHQRHADDLPAVALESAPPPAFPLTTRDLAGKSKQELIAELKQHYAEVIDLVRRVNTHLDEQQERAARLIAIAERMDRAVAVLPEIRDLHARAAASIEELVSLTRTNSERADEAFGRQARVFTCVEETLRGVETANEQLTASLNDVNGTLTGVGGAVAGMADATSGLKGVMRSIESHGDARDRQLAELLHANRRWMMLTISIAGAAVVLTTLVAIIAVA